jgi:DNA-binding NarL/FixJ family response regulator
MGIRILLVDDHALVRQALRLLLESQPDFTIAAEAGDVAHAESAAGELDPDVIVTDLLMPGPGGVELTRRLVRRKADTRIVVVTVYGTEMAALEVLRSGAMGFVSKSAPPSELFQAIREANAGRQYVGAPLSKAVIERGLRARGEAGADPYQRLTSREREVLQLAAQGLTSPAIARRLFISPRTAETHRARVMRKLSIRNQTELIFFAVKRGLLWIEPVPTPGTGARSRPIRQPHRTTSRSPGRPAPRRARR